MHVNAGKWPVLWILWDWVLRVLHHSLRKKDTFVLHTLLFHMLSGDVRRIPSPWPSLGFCQTSGYPTVRKERTTWATGAPRLSGRKNISRAASKKIQRNRLTYFTCSEGGLTLLAATTTTTTTTKTTTDNRYKSRSFFDRFCAFCCEHKGLQSSCITCQSFRSSMGVSKNRGTPKWMLYNGKLY